MACRKDVARESIHAGRYEGDFYRSCGVNENCYDPPGPTLRIDFTSDRFSGETLSGNGLVICNGNYLIKGDSIYFTNKCITEDVTDSTFLLMGAFEIREISGTKIVFRRSIDLTYPDYPIDQYTFNRIGPVPAE